MNKLLLSLLLLSLSFSLHSTAQWTTHGPYGGPVLSSCQVGNNIYIGTTAGVYKSTDAGETYSLWSTNLPIEWVSQLFFDGTTMYAGVSQFGVYISSDTGKTWSPSTTGMGNPYQFDFAFVLANNKVYSHNVFGCFYTSDHGQTWSQLTYPHQLSQYFDLFTAAGNTLFKVANNGSDTLMYRSTDGGQTWTKADAGLPPIAYDNANITNIIKENGKLYLFCQRVFTSTDDGISWVSMTNDSFPDPGPNPLQLIFIPKQVVYDGQYFYGTNGGNEYVFVCRIAPGDAQWVDITHTVPDGSSNHLFNDGTKIIINKDNALYETTNAGTLWTLNANSGITSSITSSIFADGSTVYSGQQTDIFKSTDNGQSWAESGNVFQNGVTAIHKLGSTLYASTDGYGIRHSTDGGSTWSNAALGSEDMYCITDDGTNLYTGDGGAAVYKSSNGTSFTGFSSGLPEGAVERLLVLGSNIYAATGSSQSGEEGVYKSPTASAAWVNMSSGLSNYTPFSLANSGNTLYAGMEEGGVYQSTDFATTWTALGTGIETRTVNDLLVSWTDLFAATDSGIYVLHGGSNTWQDITMNLPIRNVNALAANNDFLFAGTNGAATWQIPLTTVGIKNISTENDEITVYPNPSNGHFMVRIHQFPTTEFDLTVTDELGRIVYYKHFSSAEKNIQINGLGWSNGIYFIKMNSSEGIITQKLILNKE